MKIKSRFLAATLLASIVTSTSFGGFFVQGGVGTDSTKLTLDDTTEVKGTPTKTKAKTKATGMTLGLGLGYTLQATHDPKFKYSFIANYSMQTGKGDDNSNFDAYDYRVKTTKLSNFDFYGQVGYELSKDFMLYGNLGFATTMYSIERQVEQRTLNDTGSHITILIGLGGQMKVSEKVGIFAELKARNGKSPEESGKVAVKSQNIGLLVGAKYMF
jgi:opacity protein-like surface antigen